MPTYKDKNGTWYFRTRVKDLDGQRKEITRRGFETKKAAQMAELAFISQYSNKMEYKEISFIDLVAMYQEHIKTRLKASSIRSTNNIIKLYLLPHFKTRIINDINSRLISAWQDKILKLKKAHAYNVKIYNVFQAMFNFAIKKSITTNDPFKASENFRNSNELQEKMQYWTYEEFNKFINVIDDFKWKVYFSFLYYTGLRKGESLALNWNDIDFDKNTVIVNKNYDSRAKKLITPKTKSSYRTISFDKSLKSLLLEFKDYQKSVIKGYKDSFFIFGNGVDPWYDTTIERIKNHYCKLAGVKQIRIHDFRHSHASLLINNGANILIVSKRLGHGNINMTLNIYSHLFPDKEKEIVDLIEKINN